MRVPKEATRWCEGRKLPAWSWDHPSRLDRGSPSWQRGLGSTLATAPGTVRSNLTKGSSRLKRQSSPSLPSLQAGWLLSFSSGSSGRLMASFFPAHRVSFAQESHFFLHWKCLLFHFLPDEVQPLNSLISLAPNASGSL